MLRAEGTRNNQSPAPGRCGRDRGRTNRALHSKSVGQVSSRTLPRSLSGRERHGAVRAWRFEMRGPDVTVPDEKREALLQLLAGYGPLRREQLRLKLLSKATLFARCAHYGAMNDYPLTPSAATTRPQSSLSTPTVSTRSDQAQNIRIHESTPVNSCSVGSAPWRWTRCFGGPSVVPASSSVVRTSAVERVAGRKVQDRERRRSPKCNIDRGVLDHFGKPLLSESVSGCRGFSWSPLVSYGRFSHAKSSSWSSAARTSSSYSITRSSLGSTYPRGASPRAYPIAR